jgi:hypothetical protein
VLFRAILQALPVLDELMLHETDISGVEPISTLVNTSTRTLVCKVCVLAIWPEPVLLSSIEFLKIIDCSNKTCRDQHETWANYNLARHDNSFDLRRAVGTISLWNHKATVSIFSLRFANNVHCTEWWHNFILFLV